MSVLRVLGLMTLALGLAGCGGDGSLAGIEGTGSPINTVSGSVTSYGSIYVNGVHIDIDTADVTVNDEPAGVEAVRLGMVVDVTFSERRNGLAVADTVNYRRVLRGPVEAIEETTDARKRLTLLGQSVVVYDDAHFDGVAFADLENGVALDISGHLDDQGRWVASRVALARATAQLQLRGRVDTLDEAAGHMTVNDSRVDYADAEVLDGDLSVGIMVVVIGGNFTGADTLHPETIRVVEPAQPDNGQVLSLEGIIGRFESRSDFEVAGGLAVDASNARITGSAEALASGLRVAARGDVVDGVLQAEELRVWGNGINRVRARVGAVDPQAGTLTLMGARYRVDELTAFEDGTGSDRAPLDLSQLSAGDSVEVHAFYRGDRQIATRLKRLDSLDQTVETRGPVTAIYPANNSIRVAGVTVWVGQAEGAELFEQLSLGDKVHVRGELNGDQLEATQLSLANLPGDIDGGCPDFVPRCGGGPETGPPAEDSNRPGEG